MKVTVDTAHDSHEDIRKVIKMLQNLVGDSKEVFTNEPTVAQETSPIANIFGDVSAQPQANTPETQITQQPTEESSESTEDLFAELFSEEELKKMDAVSAKDGDEDEKDEEETKPSKGKKYDIEFY